MADHLLYAFPGSPLDTEEVLADLHVEHLVDVQAAGKSQVHDVADIAGGAVLHREDRSVHVSGLACPVCRLEIRVRDEARGGMQVLGGDVRESARDAAVRDFHTLQKTLLILRGGLDDLLGERDIILLEHGVLHKAGIGVKHGCLAIGVGDGKPVDLLVGHLLVNGVDPFPGFFQFRHKQLIMSRGSA